MGREPDRVGWYRRSVVVPSNWAGQNLFLNLGVIGDADTIYFNGEKVGEKEVEEVEFHFSHEIRKATIPAEVVKAGEANVITIRVYNKDHDGGLLGPPGYLTIAD